MVEGEEESEKIKIRVGDVRLNLRHSRKPNQAKTVTPAVNPEPPNQINTITPA